MRLSIYGGATRGNHSVNRNFRRKFCREVEEVVIVEMGI
jgi:hypothetical protein